MATKTERILSYLPSTFNALPRPSALYTVADAFGGELLAAENSLAALMAAHWVDHADRGAELLHDLACIARLYGLAPRGAAASVQCRPLPAEESVEEFREHLKRYVRTFIEGTVTVQGVLRVAAEALGLLIADDYADLDTWWTRADDSFSTIEPRGDDAASALFGLGAAQVTGSPSLPARIIGDRNLSGGVDLGDTPVLRIKVDDAAPVDIDLATRLGKTSGVTLVEIVATINDALGATIASHDRALLTLASPTDGISSRLEVQETERDAATQLLGLAPLTYRGVAADRAVIRGLVDLGGGVDLRDARYLRLLVDGNLLAEVDCTGANPESTTPEEITQAINQAIGASIASHDGQRLTLASPTEGLRSSIFLLEATAQDARARLFGSVAPVASGHDARPAEVVGLKDLRGRIDLSVRSRVRVRLDEQPAVAVDCAGSDPARTSLDEIVAALNKGAGAGLASHDGRFVHLSSPSKGTDSTLTFEPLPSEQDAADLIFGIRRKSERGAAAVHARLVGEKNLRHGFNAAALNKLLIALDGGTPIEVNLLARAADPTAVKLDELAAAFNAAFGREIATHDGERLILASPTEGDAGSVSLVPLRVTRRKRFVTRAFVLDEAAKSIFGFVARRIEGSAATKARVEGTTDLSRGVDLRAGSFLRLAVDDWPFVEIDCAGRRPRSTMPDEIIAAINNKLVKVSPTLGAVAGISADGQKLVLTSPTSGGSSRIVFEPPRAIDALDRLLGLPPQSFAGRAASSITFEGVADIREGVDLSAADRIKLSIDGGTPVEINCADPANPTRTSLDHIAAAINTALQKEVARHDGTRMILISERAGTGSVIEFQTPSQRDATALVFGIPAPRVYHGTAAQPALAVGIRDLQGGADVRFARFLRVSFDNRPVVDVDLLTGSASPEHATLADLVQTINTTLNLPIASDDGRHLILTSPTVGAASRLELHMTTGADARPKLLGNVPPLAQGDAPAPAAITGEVVLDKPLDLSGRRVLRISVDGDQPIDLDVAGVAPGTTFPEEVVARINTRLPGMASLTDENFLRLAAPTRGESSSLALLPLRVIELIEYPPTDVSDPPPRASATDDAGATPLSSPREVRHGSSWFVTNDGAADADLKVELRAPHGTVGPQLVNRTTGQRVRLLSVLRPGERAVIRRDPLAGLSAAIYPPVGEPRHVAQEEIIAGPSGAQSHVPFTGVRRLSDGDAASNASLQLNNPRAPVVVLLRAVQSGEKWNGLGVRVTEADLSKTKEVRTAMEGGKERLVGRVRSNEDGFWLASGDDETLVRLLAGAGVRLAEHVDRVAAVRGLLHQQDEGKPLLLVEHIDALFDVKLSYVPEKGEEVIEFYASVAIGTGEDDRHSLVWQINSGSGASKLVRASVADKSAALVIPRGLSRWAYFDCFGSRFDQSRYQFRLAGARCTDRAVFNFSRFARLEPEGEMVVFASAASSPEPAVELRFHWSQHQPGAFVVNLPGDLPARFGGRFNETFFGMSKDAEEIFETVFTEPVDDDNHLVTRIMKGPKRVAGTIAQSGSLLVKAEIVSRLPAGFEAVSIPFRKPRSLTRGGEDEFARLYLVEKDVPGFIALSAREKGVWGNSISVSARKSGPARFDVVISYVGARFESARLAVLGSEQLPASIQQLLQPGPVGVLQAKAAGVSAAVSRDGAEPAGTSITPQI